VGPAGWRLAAIMAASMSAVGSLQQFRGAMLGAPWATAGWWGVLREALQSIPRALAAGYEHSTAAAAAGSPAAEAGLLAPTAPQQQPPFLDWLLMAAPKKRTTHSKKRKRMAGKYLRTDCSIRRCDMCGGWKRAHSYCTPKCPGRRNLGASASSRSSEATPQVGVDASS
jgi:ribosomal protein L32